MGSTVDLPSPALPAAPALPHAEGAAAPTWGRRQLRRLGPPLLLWSIPGLVLATQLYFLWQQKEPDFAFGTALLLSFPPWLVWACFTPGILDLRQRWPLEAGRWRRSLPVHLAAFLVTTAVCYAAVVLANVAARPAYYAGEPPLQLWGLTILKSLHLSLIYYGCIIAAGYALEYQRRLREAELARAQLQAQLASAQLDALRMQLHPHFLFNTLNAISVLVRKQDTAGAVRMIAGVGELLRLALHNTGRQTVPLRQELDFIERYLALEQMRFQDRLQVYRAVDPALLDAVVPNLLLQPLVENALKHGISARAAAGRLELAASRRGEWLHLEVRDDGPGLRPDWEDGGGIGLANVRARLAQLYGERHVLRLEEHPRGGVRVVVELPLALEERP